MKVADISWMEKPNRHRDRSNYLLIAAILAALLFIGYVSEHPSSITGFAVFGTDSATSIDFGRHTVPLGASVDLTIDGKTYTKNLISILGSPYEVFYDNATVYGWDADIIMPLETFDAVKTLAPGTHTIDAVLAVNGEMLALETVTIEIGSEPEMPPADSVPVPDSEPAPEPAIEAPIIEPQPDIEPIQPDETMPIEEPRESPIINTSPGLPEQPTPQETRQESSFLADAIGTMDGLPLFGSLTAPGTPAVLGVNTFEVTLNGEPVFRTFAANECGGAIPCNCSNLVTADAALAAGVDFVTNGTCTESGLSVADNVHLDCGGLIITGDAGTTDVGVNLTGTDRSIVSNCSLTRWGLTIRIATSTNNTITQNNLSNTTNSNIRIADDVGGNHTISNNIFDQSQQAGSGAMIDFNTGGGDFNRIYNNTFIDTVGAQTAILLRSVDASYNNITNNTFNISNTAGSAIDLASGGSAANNNTFWRNTFDFLAFETISKNDTAVSRNSYCVDIGNTYVNGAETQRIFGDCGPFPKVSTIQVNSTSNGVYIVGATQRDEVNITNITFAVGNMNYTGTTVNVSEGDTGQFISPVTAKQMDGNTIDCHRVMMNGTPSAGSGFTVGDISNVTIKNCNLFAWNKGINFDDLGTTSSTQGVTVMNNVFNNSNVSGALFITDDTFRNNMIFNNTFADINSTSSDIAFVQFSGGGDNNTIRNNTFNNAGKSGATSEYGVWFRAGAQYNNVTNNTFNITNTTSVNYAIIIDNSTTADNNTIWRNIFIDPYEDPADDKWSRNRWNQTETGNFWIVFNDSSEGCDITLMRGDPDGNVLCDNSFNVSNYTGLTITDGYPSTRPFPDNDIDDDTFLNFKVNNTFPLDCDDSLSLIRPVRNNTLNYGVPSAINVCPGMYNVSVNISNSSVLFNCSTTTILTDQGSGAGSQGTGITINDFDAVNVTNCILANYSVGAIALNRTVNSRIINITINNSVLGITGTSINETVIYKNSIYNLTGTDAVSLTGYSYRNNITYNIIRNISGANGGIYVDGNATNTTVSFNNITNVTSGILIRGNSGSNGYPYNNTVSQNRIGTATLAGISFLAAGTEPNRPQNISISNNYLFNATAGFQIQSLYNSTFFKDELYNNSVQINYTGSNGTFFTNVTLNGSFGLFVNSSNFNATNISFVNQNGSIVYGGLNVTAGIDLVVNRTVMNFSVQNISEVMSGVSPALNRPANVTMINAPAGFTTPVVFVSDAGGTYTKCPANRCNNFVNLGGGTYTFNVLSFSNHSIGEDNDADNDTFFTNIANQSHPIDCADADADTRPLFNSTNNTFQKNIRICPGTYNVTVTIDNSSTRFDCNSTVTLSDLGITGTGITVNGFSNVNITNCTITKYSGGALGIDARNGVNFQIVQNTLTNDGTAVQLLNVNESRVENNRIDNLTNNGITLTNNVFRTNVSLNRISNNSGSRGAIRSSANLSNATIAYNNITGTVDGIILEGSSGSITFNSTVTQNRITHLNESALLVTDTGAPPNVSNNLSVTNNFIMNTTRALDLLSLANTTFLFNELINNTINLNATNSASLTLTNTTLNGTVALFVSPFATFTGFNFTFRAADGQLRYVNFSGSAADNITIAAPDINITSNRIVVNQTAVSRLNATAELTFYGLTYTSTPQVLKDGSVCSDCTVLSYDATNGILVVNASSMGTFTTRTAPDESVSAGAPSPATPAPPQAPAIPLPPQEAYAPPAEAATAALPAEVAAAAEPAAATPEAGAGAADAKMHVPKRFAFGEGLGLLEAKQDGKVLFVNNKFGTDISLQPEQVSKIELTVVNTGTSPLDTVMLDVDARGVAILAKTPDSATNLKRGDTATFTLQLEATGEQSIEHEVTLRWRAIGAHLDKEFVVRIEARPEKKVTAAFLFKRWLAPSLTVLVMFLTGTILLMGIQTFGAGQVEKVTQGVVGPIFRDTLVDEDTLRRLIRSKLLSHYGTLWVTRSAYLKFKPQFSQLKLVKLSTDSLRTATELNARFHLGMEMATLLSFATRKKLIAQLDLMPGKILTARDLPSGVTDEVDGVDIVNPFGTDVAPDKKLVLDSCISLPDYTGALMEHLVAGLTNGFTYSQLTSRLLATGWPSASVSKHLTALKTEIGYLERHLLDVYYYAGFDQLDDEKTKEKAFKKLFEHGHDQRLVALAFKNITINYGQLSCFLAAGIAAHKPVSRMVSQLVKQGWDQKIVDRALIAVESATEEKESEKKDKKEEKKEKKEVKEPIAKKPAEKKHSAPSHSLPAPHHPQPTTHYPLPLPTAAFTTPEKTSGIPFAYLTITRRDYDTAQAQRHAKETLSPLRRASADFVAFKTKLLEKEISYLRTGITRRAAELVSVSLSDAELKERLKDHLSMLIAGRHDRTLVERIAHDVCADVEKLRNYMAAVAGRPDAELVRRELLNACWNTKLVDTFTKAPASLHAVKAPEEKKQPHTTIGSIVQSIKESLALKVSHREEEYLRSAVEQLFAIAHRTKPVAELEKTFVADATTSLVKKGYAQDLVESVVAEKLPLLITRAREEERQETERQRASQKKRAAPHAPKQDAKKKPLQLSLSVPSSPGILGIIKEKIAAKEQAYLRGYAEQLFESAIQTKGFSAIRTTFVSDTITRLVSRGYHPDIVEQVVKEVFAHRSPAAAAEERKQHERRTLRLQQEPKKEKQPSRPAEKPAAILATVQRLIAGKEEDYILRFARQAFAAGKTGEDVVEKLVEKGHDAGVVHGIVRSIPARQAPKQRPVLPSPPVKKVFTPPKTAPRLLLNQRLLDQILAEREQGASLIAIRNRLQSQYGERLLSFHLSLAEKMGRKLKNQVRKP